MRIPLALILRLGFALLATPLRAAESNEVHRFRFFLHPDVVGTLSMTELQRRLTYYVEDINTIFAKQTIRRFSFDPATGITLTTNTPYSSHAGLCPETGYEIWAHVIPSDNTNYGSYGGYMSVDDSCAGVAAGLHWDSVHDREALRGDTNSWRLTQYWRQVHHMTHEIEHVFGGGYGEYYNLRYVMDSTGVPPLLNLYYYAAGDPFWSAHADYLTDPLTLWTPELSYSNLMDQVRFADVTAAVVNARFRWSIGSTLPDLSRTRIVARDQATGTPITNATVKAWKIRTFSPYVNELLLNANTDSNGVVQFAWRGAFNNYDLAMLIKVYDPNHQPAARWVSIFDAQEAKMVRHEDTFSVTMFLNAAPRLTIRRFVPRVQVEWPSTATNFVLKTSASLTSPLWQTVTNAVTSTGGTNSVSIPAQESARFFRLER